MWAIVYAFARLLGCLSLSFLLPYTHNITLENIVSTSERTNFYEGEWRTKGSERESEITNSCRKETILHLDDTNIPSHRFLFSKIETLLFFPALGLAFYYNIFHLTLNRIPKFSVPIMITFDLGQYSVLLLQNISDHTVEFTCSY